ncbi:MAG: acyltransferase [Thermomicrobiales bacterium]
MKHLEQYSPATTHQQTAIASRRANIATLLARVRHRLHQHSLLSLFLGLLLRRSFSRAGLLVREPGWPPLVIRNDGGYIEAANCTFYPGVRLECWRGAHISIGNGTYLNRNTEIIAQQEVRIGRDCKIAWDVVIMDTDQHGIAGAAPVAKPVYIGDRVWLGCRALVLKGVTIGDDAIIGAGAIVTKDVPPRAVVAGQAARAIRLTG